MVDDDLKRYDGKALHPGPDHIAPYPVSRLAPAIGLVDFARQVAHDLPARRRRTAADAGNAA
ncbi:MAG: hypothetical protein WCC36_10075 [Gammaproteobacteria bacterium]